MSNTYIEESTVIRRDNWSFRKSRRWKLHIYDVPRVHDIKDLRWYTYKISFTIHSHRPVFRIFRKLPEIGDVRVQVRFRKRFHCDEIESFMHPNAVSDVSEFWRCGWPLCSHYVSHQRFGLCRLMRAGSLTGNGLTFCLSWYVLLV